MTIYEVKYRHLALVPDSHFFDASALRFFGQTMRSFGVHSLGNDKYEIRAPMYMREGGKRKYIGMTVRIFDYTTGALTLPTSETTEAK